MYMGVQSEVCINASIYEYLGPSKMVSAANKGLGRCFIDFSFQ